VILRRLRRLLPALWAGGLLCVALLATPAPFAMLTASDAGRVVGRILGQEAWASLLFAIVLLALERGHARDMAIAGRGSVLSTEMLLLLGAIFCTVTATFGIQPLMAAARSGQSSLSFGQLHLASTTLFGLKTVLVLALAWRNSRDAQ
jgi:hypothetical protein